MKAADASTFRSRRRRWGAMAQEQAYTLAFPFSRLEKLLLVGFAVTAIAPYAFNSVINMWELAIAAFVLLSPIFAKVVRRNLGILFILSIAVVIGQLNGTSGLAETTATLAFLKVCVYVCFISIIGLRCKNPDNRKFFLKYIVLPVTLLFTLSVWIDLFSGTRFFAQWQDTMFFRTNPVDNEVYSSYMWFDLLDQLNRSSGLAQRPWHVVAWALCGLLALLTLRSHGQFKSRWFWVFLPVLFITPPLLPQRNGLVGMGTALIVYLVLAQREGTSSARPRLIVAGVALLAAFVFLQPALTNEINQSQGYYSDYFQTTSLVRLLDIPNTGIIRTIDPRVDIFLTDATWLVDNPLYLIFGTGWNIVIAPSTKPHSLYMSVLVGSGILGLVTLIVFMWHTLAQQVGPRSVWQNTSVIAKTGLITLAVVGLFDSYMTGRLGVPASFLALWLALCVIAAQRPEPVVEEEQSKRSYRRSSLARRTRGLQTHPSTGPLPPPGSR